MLKAQASGEMVVLLAIVLFAVTALVFPMLSETELNIALGSARNTCNAFAEKNQISLSQVNYDITDRNVTIMPQFSSALPNSDLLKAKILASIDCSIHHSPDVQDCLKQKEISFLEPGSRTMISGRYTYNICINC